MLFPTTIVGSFPQPEWLIDRAKLAGRFPPRVRAKELWRLQEPYLALAQDDATLLAIKAQEEAGLDMSEHGMYGYPEQFIPAPELVGYASPVEPAGAPTPVATSKEVTA